jgi:GTPase SAR1 family protein
MIDRYLLYLIGLPGAGKSTLLNTALKDVPGREWPSPFVHIQYPHGAQLGAQRSPFGGTDALALNVQPKVIQWLDHCPYRYVVAEGDRLANRKFFAAVINLGWHLTVALVDVPPVVAQRRRTRRGALQSEIWAKGRLSKLQALLPLVNWRLDGLESISALADQLNHHIAMRGLREG